jgi:hypothetical protein
MLQIGLTSLSTKMLGSLAEETLALSARNEMNEITAHPLYLSLKSSQELYHANVIKPVYSGLGPELAGADALRDRYHAGLHRLLRGFATFGDTDKGQAAKKLLACFDETGSVTRLNYAEETVVQEKLLDKLNTEANKALLDILGLTAEVGLLSESQATFNSLFLTQVDVNSQLRQQPSATSLRSELTAALRNYFGYISVMQGVAPWNDLYMDMKELVKKYKSSPSKPAVDTKTSGPATNEADNTL